MSYSSPSVQSLRLISYHCAQPLQALGMFPQSSLQGEILTQAAQNMQQRSMVDGLSSRLPPQETPIKITEDFSFSFMQQARA